MYPSLDQVWRQVDLAEFLEVSEKTVSEWTSEGLFDGAETGAEKVRAVYRRLSETAAGRVGSLAVERARLARAQAENVETKNAVLRREYAPVVLLQEALGRACRQMAGVLEALPVKLRKRSQILTAEDIKFIETEIAELRNIAAASVLESDGGIEEEPEEMRQIATNAAL